MGLENSGAYHALRAPDSAVGELSILPVHRLIGDRHDWQDFEGGSGGNTGGIVLHSHGAYPMRQGRHQLSDLNCIVVCACQERSALINELRAWDEVLHCLQHAASSLRASACWLEQAMHALGGAIRGTHVVGATCHSNKNDMRL